MSVRLWRVILLGEFGVALMRAVSNRKGRQDESS